MKQKHILSLLQEGYTTIKVQFLTSTKQYTYKAPLSDDLKVEDHVVVDSPIDGLVVARVMEVHSTPQIDVDADFAYKWIVQKVDRKRYDEQVEKEREFAQHLLEIERVRQRELLLNNFRTSLPEGTTARAMFDNTVKSVSCSVGSTINTQA